MKIVGWLIKMTVTAAFLAVVTLYATWTAVGTYLDKVLAHYQLGGGMQDIGFSDFLEKMGAGLNIMNQTVSVKDDKPVYGGSGLSPAGTAEGSNAASGRDAASGAASGAAGTAAGNSQAAGQSPNGGASGTNGSRMPGREDKEGSAGSVSEAGGMADALPVWSQSGSTQSAQTGGTGEQASGKVLFSSDFLSSAKDNMTNEDKVKLFALLVSKLPAQEVQNISQLMEDGLTQGELEQIDGIIRKHLTDEEYRQVLVILEKYQ